MSTRLEDYRNAPEHQGALKFEKSKKGDWYLLELDHDFHQALIGKLEALGMLIKPNKRPHISVAKGEFPSLNRDDWGAFAEEVVKFKYDTTFHHENGWHVWINCFSERLCQIREHFGLVALRQDDQYMVNFHTTIGRLVIPVDRKLRPQYRLCPQSHIDVETGMQHL